LGQRRRTGFGDFLKTIDISHAGRERDLFLGHLPKPKASR
jgi:hypothetical protein